MTLTPAALQALAAYKWPGNVRELKNLMEYLAAAELAQELLPSHLPAHVTGSRRPASEAVAPPPASSPAAAPSPAAPPAAASDPSGPSDGDSGPLRPLADELREIEQRRIAQALQRTRGKRKAAAELLRIPLRTFTLKLKQYGLGGGSAEGSTTEDEGGDEG